MSAVAAVVGQELRHKVIVQLIVGSHTEAFRAFIDEVQPWMMLEALYHAHREIVNMIIAHRPMIRMDLEDFWDAMPGGWLEVVEWAMRTQHAPGARFLRNVLRTRAGTLSPAHLLVAEMVVQHSPAVVHDPNDDIPILHDVCYCRWPAAPTRFLLAHGANPNTLDPDGQTALQILCGRRWTSTVPEAIVDSSANQVDAARVLIEAGIDVHHVDRLKTATALHYAIGGKRFDMLPLLFNAGASPNIMLDTIPAVFVTMREEWFPMLSIFLRHGYDLALINTHTGQTLYQYAVAHGHDNVVRAIDEHIFETEVAPTIKNAGADC